MRRLILLRHGQAEPSARTGDDLDRALTPRGRADACAAGTWLLDQGATIHLALVSPALRARQTWEEASAEIPAARLEQPDSLYDADPRRMLALAEAAAEDTVLVVAHNPGLHALALRLAESDGTPEQVRAALRRGLPPAGVAVLARDAMGRLAGEAFHAPAGPGASG